MGIRADARNDFLAALAARKPTLTRAQLRRYVAELNGFTNEWLNKRDEQDNAAAAGFAASRQGQFNTFVDALPDVELAPVNAND